MFYLLKQIIELRIALLVNKTIVTGKQLFAWKRAVGYNR